MTKRMSHFITHMLYNLYLVIFYCYCHYYYVMLSVSWQKKNNCNSYIEHPCVMMPHVLESRNLSSFSSVISFSALFFLSPAYSSFF